MKRGRKTNPLIDMVCARYVVSRRQALRFLIEVDGGTRTHGGHSCGAGQKSDYEKQTALTLRGYRVLRFTTEQVEDGTAINTILEALR